MAWSEGFCIEDLDKLIFYSDHFWYGKERVFYASISGIYFNSTEKRYKMDGILTGTSFQTDLRMLLPKRRILTIKPDFPWFNPRKKEKALAMAKASKVLHDRSFAWRIALYEKQLSEKGFVQWEHYRIGRNGDLFKRKEYLFNVLEQGVSNKLLDFTYTVSKKFSFQKSFTRALGSSQTITIAKDRDCFLYIMKHYLGITWPDTPVKQRVYKQKQQGQRQEKYAAPAASHGSNHEHLKTLGLSNAVTIKEIKIAYRSLARKHHPDLLRAKGVSKVEIDYAEEKLKKINVAYNWLSGNYNPKDNGV